MASFIAEAQLRSGELDAFFNDSRAVSISIAGAVVAVIRSRSRVGGKSEISRAGWLWQ